MKHVIFNIRNGSDKKSSFTNIIKKYFDVVEVNPCNSIMTELDTLIPDLIAIDVSSCKQDAYQISQQVKFSDKYYFIPLVFVDSAFSIEDKARLIESGADGYLEEPFYMDTTISYLEALISKGQSQKKLFSSQAKNQVQKSNFAIHEPDSFYCEDDSLFKDTSQQSAVGIFYTTMEGDLLKVNARFCEIVGYTQEELLSIKSMDITYPDESETEAKMLKKMLDGDIDSFEIEKRYIHKSGYFVHALVHVDIVYNSKDVPYYISSVLDITDIRTSQQRLKRSEEKYRTYVDNSPHPIFVTDIFGMVLDVNPAACSHTEYSAEELMGMNILDLCNQESMSETTDYFLRVETEGEASGEFLFTKKDGTDFYMQIEAVMLNGNKLLALCVDTTVRNLSEKMLMDAKVLAEHASNSKSEFLANISHELRTPLDIIIGYTDVLLNELSDKLNEEQLKYFCRINEAGSNLLETVNSLIYVAEIEAGNCELDIINFDLKPMVVELENIFRPMASKKNVMIEFEIGTGLECIFADDSKFNAILHNLIENAIKFNREGGSVKIIFEDAGNDIRVQVIDTGIGILEDKQEIFFEPFVQLDWSHARRYSGVGIGLSLVKGLVEMHGGKISLVSKVGEGTTVTFTIPQKL